MRCGEIGIDEISIRKGHTYRIVVSDLLRGRPIWFGGTDRSEADMAAFYDLLGPEKSQGIRLAVMDMWKPFRNVMAEKAPNAAILFDKFHIMLHLGEALDEVRKSEYARLSGRRRRFIKGSRSNSTATACSFIKAGASSLLFGRNGEHKVGGSPSRMASHGRVAGGLLVGSRKRY